MASSMKPMAFHRKAVAPQHLRPLSGMPSSASTSKEKA